MLHSSFDVEIIAALLCCNFRDIVQTSRVAHVSCSPEPGIQVPLGVQGYTAVKTQAGVLSNRLLEVPSNWLLESTE